MAFLIALSLSLNDSQSSQSNHNYNNTLSASSLSSNLEPTLPPFAEEAKLFDLNEPTNTSCVNWNQYYTICMPKGENPFQGTISFDNIGMAWVAIFLVSSLSSHALISTPKTRHNWKKLVRITIWK